MAQHLPVVKRRFDMILSAGDCPVCSALGRVIFLTAEPQGVVFVACNSCKGASLPTDTGDNWLRQPVEDYAPTGFRAASQQEVMATGFDMRRVIIVSEGEFQLLL
jgi:hypothetical protein